MKTCCDWNNIYLCVYNYIQTCPAVGNTAAWKTCSLRNGSYKELMNEPLLVYNATGSSKKQTAFNTCMHAHARIVHGHTVNGTAICRCMYQD